MKLKDIDIHSFRQKVNYICNLCGYPAVQDEKMKVVYDFLRDQQGSHDDEDLIKAFTALAAGRIDEKMDSIKSFTGLSASRVMDSWSRSQRKDTGGVQPEKDATGKDRSFLNDENRDLIQKEFGRYVRYADELSKDEHNYLMDYWIDRNKAQFKETKNIGNCTATAFNHLEKMGCLRVQDGIFQYYHDKHYIDICAWEQIEAGGMRTKYNDDIVIQKAKGSDFRTLRNPFAGVSLQEATKRYAISVYFDYIA